MERSKLKNIRSHPEWIRSIKTEKDAQELIRKNYPEITEDKLKPLARRLLFMSLKVREGSI